MKRLYVGCRVRILWSSGWPELAGEEGRVVEPARITIGPNAGVNGWRVAPDCWGSFRAPRTGAHGGTAFCALPDQLEPIQDPGHQVISWEEMRGLWQPQGVEA